MGSFTQVALSFDFRTETPPEVLAAFSALASPDGREGTPQLPPPNVEPWDEFAPDWREQDHYWRERGHAEGQGDPFEDPVLVTLHVTIQIQPRRHAGYASAVSGLT